MDQAGASHAKRSIAREEFELDVFKMNQNIERHSCQSSDREEFH